VDVVQYFLPYHDVVHVRWKAQLVAGLTPEQIRARPHPAVNSIAWLLWHVARTEDVAVSAFVAIRPQLAEEEDWFTRLNVPRRDIGTGMTDDEVVELGAQIDLEALDAYWDAISKRTRSIVEHLDPAELDEVVDPAYAREAIVRGGLLQETQQFAWEGWQRGHTRGYFLNYLAAAHVTEHMGEARVARALHGFRGR
jgi:hypothetical protein